MTRKHLARRAVECCCREPRIDRGGLDIGMSQPILHKRQVCPGIKQVCGNRMLQTLALPLLHWQPRDLTIRLHEVMQHVAAYLKLAAHADMPPRKSPCPALSESP